MGCAVADPINEQITISSTQGNDVKRILLEMMIQTKIIEMGAACHTRYTLKECLLEILKKTWKEETKRKRAIKVLDNLVANVQINYSAVIREHNNLKNILLKPK